MIVLWIALAGGLGAALRYVVDEVLRRRHTLAGTYVVNALGSLLLGFLVAGGGSPVWGTGFCGGFTTLSTVSLQAAERLLSRRWVAALAHLVAMLVLCAGAAFLGTHLARA